MDEYPFAREFLGQNLQNHELLDQLEEALRLNNELADEEDALHPKLEELMIDVTVIKQGELIAKNTVDDMGEANEMMQGCLAQITEMENLLKEVGLEDSLYYTVERQEQRVERKLKVHEAHVAHGNKQNAILESRDLVKELRRHQLNEYKNAELQSTADAGLEQLDREWTITIRDLKDLRNTKTVNVGKMSEKVNELQAQFQKMNLIKNGSTEEDIDAMEAIDDPQPSVKKSARDFLNDFLFKEPDEGDDDVEESEIEAPLRSILVKKPTEDGNDDSDLFACSPSKRVRFASSPELNQILELEEPNWPYGSAEGEEVEEPLADDEEEVSEEELEEPSGGEFEIDSDEELRVESDDDIEILDEGLGVEVKFEMPDEESGLGEIKSSSDVMESGSEHKESGGEASGEEEPDDGAGKVDDGIKPELQEQKTTNPDAQRKGFSNILEFAAEKPKILKVDIIPPRKIIYPEDNDDVPSTSTGIRNRFTASQFSKHAIDHTGDSQAKRIKLDEEEFPMAQPLPSTFESNDDHILQFNSPETNMLDDYLLNFSDDNDVGLDGASYIL
ncbi:hypothetical protein KR084_008104 [Drosophila pseudotakahashii]|nr:hypothetical protein KR084_008104 [Drosophila pseudotakahashii]